MVDLNLGSSDQCIADFINVDRWTPSWATKENFQRVDLTKKWPWEDSSVHSIRAHDIIEHLPQKTFTMNEAWRVLEPGGLFEIVVPTTDGRGAWQDPTHVSYWNRNSFFYYTNLDAHRERFGEAYGVVARFEVVREVQETLADSIVKLTIVLKAIK